LKRNKSFSQSKSLFSKAHSVNKHESFISKKDKNEKDEKNIFKVQLTLLPKEITDKKGSFRFIKLKTKINTHRRV